MKERIPGMGEFKDWLCNICGVHPYSYDAKSIAGPWAFMCNDCYRKYGSKKEGLYKKTKPKGVNYVLE